MPPKKRQSIGQVHPKAKEAKRMRASETPEQREARVEQSRTRASTSRAAETPEEREVRIEQLRTRASTSRAAETPEQRDARVEQLRTRASASRATETPEQRETRVDRDRLRTAQAREMFRQDNLRLKAFTYDPQYNYHTHSKVLIGKMDVVCEHCNAKKFRGEAPGMCCSNGKVKLAPLQEPPEPLKTYMSGNTQESKHFLKRIRKYNSCFQMTSFGATAILDYGFMPTFKVQGQIYHRTGSVLPPPNEDPKFLQIYFMGDEQLQADRRCATIPETRRDIVLSLQRLLHSRNHLIRLFKTALDRMPTDEYKVVIRADKRPAGEHERRYNAPTINEVAILIVGQECDRRDIVIQRRSESLQRISETHRSYDALQYPLIFWEGEDGYHFNVMQTDPRTGIATQKKVSSMDYYAYRIMIRDGLSNHILKCRDVFHQFIVDMYAKVESERLLFIRLNQKQLRVDDYIHLRDAIASDRNVADIGRMVILPATFTGGPRHMHEYAQDAMSYVRTHGRPDLFITFTCNPAWEIINEHLFPGQNATDRHDIIARVFKQKLAKLIDVIKNGHIFGEPRCWMYSVEWQKRGLPHAHILFWLKEKIRTTQIDKIISAELPESAKDPLLYTIVSRNMVHGPCGPLNPQSPCMKDGKCTKRYPRPFVNETQTGNDGYPLYRRRSPENGGFQTKVRVKVNNRFTEVQVDNRWVVPYSPILSKMFQAHINVEYCNSVKSIKYICKYVNKGSDMAVFGLEDQNSADEVKQYQLGRYINSNEAIWRLLSFPIHERHPTVFHLSVHLENGQRVYFTEDTARERAAQPQDTTLTSFLKLCEEDTFAETLLYAEVPKYYTWDTSRRKFCRRKRGAQVPEYPDIFMTDAIGRVYTIHPNNAECYFLRMLLHSVRGPKSFADLKTVGGEICETYREACQRSGLLENDQHWDNTLAEASISTFPQQLRDLFAIIITTCAPSNPKSLWEKYKENLSEDILRDARRADNSINYCTEIYNQALIRLEDKCILIAGKTLLQLGLEAPNRDGNEVLDRDIWRENNYDAVELQTFVEQNKPRLVSDQRQAFDTIVHLIDSQQGGIFFLDAPGGTGKTFLINLLLSEVRRRGEIALALASSGIASTLLMGGRTAHSALKLPLDLHRKENPICNISKSSGQAQVLKQCKLIVWDECTMAHKGALEALDRTMRDIRANRRLMGGATVVLAGDFRQTLPVIPRSTPADEMNACLKASPIWRHVQSKTLQTNMRVHLRGETGAEVFAQQLLQLGDGKFPEDPLTGLISFPTNFCTVLPSADDLIDKVFPNINDNFRNHQWLCERAILAPKNDSVNKINDVIQEKVAGSTTTYKSIDTVVDVEQAVFYTTEFLNSLEPSGMPPHNLNLKIGSPIILLRNIDPPKLCNGTRLSVKRLQQNVIEATIITGNAKGEDVFIPRIPMIPGTTDLPFDFKRLQYPVRLAFAMTINKAQGQSLNVAGINLHEACFSHGQLYVACSRVGTPTQLWIYAPDGQTKNVVYRQALQ